MLFTSGWSHIVDNKHAIILIWIMEIVKLINSKDIDIHVDAMELPVLYEVKV